MSVFVNDGGVEKEAKMIYVNDGGVQKDVTVAWVFDGGLWKKAYTLARIPAIGEPWEGGFFAGLYTMEDNLYGLIVADKSSQTSLPWKEADTHTAGTFSVIDGLANSIAMVNHSLSHPAGEYCRSYRGGGFDDWFLPAKNQLEICYFNLKPTTNSNSTSSGANPNAVPPRGNYTANNPGQTDAPDFKSGGVQAFDSANYMTSTQESPSNAYSFHQFFGSGTQTVSTKTTPRGVRPCRSVLLPEEFILS